MVEFIHIQEAPLPRFCLMRQFLFEAMSMDFAGPFMKVKNEDITPSILVFVCLYTRANMTSQRHRTSNSVE